MEFIDFKYLRNPEQLERNLLALRFKVLEDSELLLEKQIFNSLSHIKQFTDPILTLVGILCSAPEMGSVKITWVTMKY